jgi:hypothetical protein
VRARSARLPQEVAALDAVRAALGAGDPERGLELLAEYARDFRRGELVPEATVLHIEALLAAGRRSSAEKLAREFLRKNPSGHYAGKVVRLLERAARP